MIRKSKPVHETGATPPSYKGSLRVGLLSPALRLQPGRRPPCRESPIGQRPQRGGMGGGPPAIIDRYRRRRQTVVVRADPTFALPAFYEALERRRVRDAIRPPANAVPERQIEDLLTRPRGRPSHAPLVRYRRFHYQAASWERPRRVIAKVEHHLGEIFPRVGLHRHQLTGRAGPLSGSTTRAARAASG